MIEFDAVLCVEEGSDLERLARSRRRRSPRGDWDTHGPDPSTGPSRAELLGDCDDVQDLSCTDRTNFLKPSLVTLSIDPDPELWSVEDEPDVRFPSPPQHGDASPATSGGECFTQGLRTSPKIRHALLGAKALHRGTRRTAAKEPPQPLIGTCRLNDDNPVDTKWVQDSFALLQQAIARLAEQCSSLEAAAAECKNLNVQEEAIAAQHRRLMEKVLPELSVETKEESWPPGDTADAEGLDMLQRYVASLTNRSFPPAPAPAPQNVTTHYVAPRLVPTVTGPWHPAHVGAWPVWHSTTQWVHPPLQVRPVLMHAPVMYPSQ